MNNFLFENKTKVYFGKGGVKEYLGCLLKHYGDTVMLAYGGGSIKHNGVYDEIVGILNAEGKRIVEFPGIMPNPTYAKVQEGAKLARENHVDLILAVGGGSVSDCCKVVSAQAKVDEDLWELENTKHTRPTAFIPLGTIVGSILPLVIGMVLGNLFPFIKNLLVPGANPAIAVIGFQLGASMSLSSFITGGISGILLGLITLFIVGPITFAFERLCGGNGKAAVACSTIAGTAMTTPVALAEVAPRYAELAPTAYAQIATAVIITAIMAPILTGWVDKKFCHGKEDLSLAGVEAIEEAVATDIDGE